MLKGAEEHNKRFEDCIEQAEDSTKVLVDTVDFGVRKAKRGVSSNVYSTLELKGVG
jgi:hypothetical protein